MLQTASAFKQKVLDVKTIESISGVIPNDVVRKIDKVLSQNADGGFGEVQQLSQDLILDGFDVQQLDISGRPRLFDVDDSLVQQLKLRARPEVLNPRRSGHE